MGLRRRLVVDAEARPSTAGVRVAEQGAEVDATTSTRWPAREASGRGHDSRIVGRGVVGVVAWPPARGARGARKRRTVAPRDSGLERHGKDVREQWLDAGNGGTGMVGRG